MTMPHGTQTRYQGGCRCDACTAAHREYGRRKRAEAKMLAEERADQKVRLAALMACARPRVVKIHGVGEVSI